MARGRAPFCFINLWLIADRHRYCTYLYYLQRQFRTRVVKAIQRIAIVDFLDYEVEFNHAHGNGLYEIGGLGMLQDFLLRNFRAQMGEL